MRHNDCVSVQGVRDRVKRAEQWLLCVVCDVSSAAVVLSGARPQPPIASMGPARRNRFVTAGVPDIRRRLSLPKKSTPPMATGDRTATYSRDDDEK